MLSERMCRLIETAIRCVLKNAADLRQQFRLDVRVHPVAILADHPHCVSLRLIKTQQGVGRNANHQLKDKLDRLHFPEILMMECPTEDKICVMFSSTYSPFKNQVEEKNWDRFSQTVRYPLIECGTKEAELVKHLVDFLTFGLYEGRPYRGYLPH